MKVAVALVASPTPIASTSRLSRRLAVREPERVTLAGTRFRRQLEWCPEATPGHVRCPGRHAEATPRGSPD